MFSIISLHKSMASRFQEHAGKIAAVNSAITFIAILFIYNLAGSPGSFLSPSLLAADIISVVTILFIFDAIRYFISYQKNNRTHTPRSRSSLHHIASESRATELSPSGEAQDIHSVQKTFLDWYLQPRSSPPDEEYHRQYAQKMEPIKKLSRAFQRREMKLYYSLDLGFKFYFGYIKKQHRYIPISLKYGMMLFQQYSRGESLCWALWNPQDNSYFVPTVVTARVMQGSGTIDCLRRLLSEVGSPPNTSSYQYRILEALTPYAADIHSTDNDLYQQIRQLMPNIYPENPGQMGPA